MPDTGGTDTGLSPLAKDWFAWHEPYEVAGSMLAVRLALVQSYIRLALDTAPPGEIRVISLCAGQGRDLLGVLESHPRAGDVRARLVELDERNASIAKATAERLGLSATVEVRQGDAAETDHYLDLVPAHLVICCGVFGNVSDADVHRICSSFPSLCNRDGLVIWTRHRRPPDLNEHIREWVRDEGFEEVGFEAPSHLQFVGVGAALHRGEPQPLATGERLFEWREDPLPPT